jgi:hypothetical protein
MVLLSKDWPFMTDFNANPLKTFFLTAHALLRNLVSSALNIHPRHLVTPRMFSL